MRSCWRKYSILVLNIVQLQLRAAWKIGEKLEVSRIRTPYLTVCPLNGRCRAESACYFTECQRTRKRRSKVVEVEISSAESFCSTEPVPRANVTHLSTYKFKVARSPVFSRSTNLESKLIDFSVFLNESRLEPFTVRKIGDFPRFLSALASNNAFIAERISARLWMRDLFSQCTYVRTYVRTYVSVTLRNVNLRSRSECQFAL